MDKQKSIKRLNEARGMELQVIHQYMVQHYALDSTVGGEDASYMKLTGVDEMRHAEKFAERIRELGGVPTTEKAGPVVANQKQKEMYDMDVNHEELTITRYTHFENELRASGDTKSADLFKSILEEEKIHLEYFKSKQQ